MKRRRNHRQDTSISPRRVLLKQGLIGFLLLLVMTAVLYGVWHVTRLPYFTIDSIEVFGGSTIPHDSIMASVEETLEGNYWHLIPKRFTWFYPKVDAENVVKKNDRIKNVLVERDGRVIRIVFEEFQPAALWCKDRETKDCLFIDKTGYAFAAAPYLEGTAFMRYSDVAVEPVLGESVFAGDYVEAINSFVATAYDQMALNIIHVEKAAPDELVYYVAGGGEIKVSARQPVNETLENLETILTSPDFEHLEPGNFKYIDLRFGNKIFVNEGKEETATSSEAGGGR